MTMNNTQQDTLIAKDQEDVQGFVIPLLWAAAGSAFTVGGYVFAYAVHGESLAHVIQAAVDSYNGD
jgi:hypothetical protein